MLTPAGPHKCSSPPRRQAMGPMGAPLHGLDHQGEARPKQRAEQSPNIHFYI